MIQVGFGHWPAERRSQLPHHLWKRTISPFDLLTGVGGFQPSARSQSSKKKQSERKEDKDDVIFNFFEIFSNVTEHLSVSVACKVKFIDSKPFFFSFSPRHMNSLHEYVAINSREATNPNTQHSQKTWLLFLWMKEKAKSPFLSLQRLLEGIKGGVFAWLVPAPASMNQDEAVKETFNGRANSS